MMLVNYQQVVIFDVIEWYFFNVCIDRFVFEVWFNVDFVLDLIMLLQLLVYLELEYGLFLLEEVLMIVELDIVVDFDVLF